MTNKPGFLIIGAMKAGTTTLYEDLRPLSGLYLPPEKEPEDLIRPEIHTPEGQAAYFAKFDGAAAGDLCGEASTAYTKRPLHDAPAQIAHDLLGSELKLIYMTRHPVKRAVSHYHHNWGMGLDKRPLNEAILADPTYADFSRYAWQLEPWQAAFDPKQILVIAFEDYLADRPATLAQICAFLGVAPPAQEAINETHRNKSAGKAFVPRGGALEQVMNSRLYQYTLKPLMNSAMRDRIKALVLPKAGTLNDKLNAPTEVALSKKLATDPRAAAYLDPKGQG